MERRNKFEAEYRWQRGKETSDVAKYGRITNAIYYSITILLAAQHVDIISLCIFLWTVTVYFSKLVSFFSGPKLLDMLLLKLMPFFKKKRKKLLSPNT